MHRSVLREFRDVEGRLGHGLIVGGFDDLRLFT